MRMRPEASLQMAPPNGRPPDSPSSTNKNRYQPERTSASRYIIPARRHRGNTVSGKNVGTTRKHQILAKIGDENLVHSANFHLEGDSNHGSETKITVTKEKEQNTRKFINCNLRGINQNLQKIQENNKKFESRNKIIIEYEELLVAKLIANPMELRKCAATMLRAGKQEGFESTRCDTFDSTYEDGRL